MHVGGCVMVCGGCGCVKVGVRSRDFFLQDGRNRYCDIYCKEISQCCVEGGRAPDFQDNLIFFTGQIRRN